MRNLSKLVWIFGTFFLMITTSSCISLLMDEEFNALQKAKIFMVSNDGKAIILNGVINSSALKEFKALYKKYPSVKTLRIVNCDGSIDDRINLKLASFVHEKGLNTYLEDYGTIASGGTDLFLAGLKRTKGVETQIGVHSWAGNGKKGKLVTAKEFPIDDKNHQPYIEYYKTTGFTQKQAEDFYFFTIHAASAEDIHWMTKEEIRRYQLIAD